MLWSLVKILIFVGLVTAATYGAVMLGEISGHAQITLAGLEFRLGPVESLVAILVFIGLVWLLFKFIGLAAALFRFLNGDETALSRYFTRNRERRGYEALADGMMALASGEGHLALAKAAKKLSPGAVVLPLSGVAGTGVTPVLRALAAIVRKRRAAEKKKEKKAEAAA